MDGILLVCMLCSATKAAVGQMGGRLCVYISGPDQGEILWHKQELLLLVKQLKEQKSITKIRF